MGILRNWRKAKLDRPWKRKVWVLIAYPLTMAFVLLLMISITILGVICGTIGGFLKSLVHWLDQTREAMVGLFAAAQDYWRYDPNGNGTN